MRLTIARLAPSRPPLPSTASLLVATCNASALNTIPVALAGALSSPRVPAALMRIAVGVSRLVPLCGATCIRPRPHPLVPHTVTRSFARQPIHG